MLYSYSLRFAIAVRAYKICVMDKKVANRFEFGKTPVMQADGGNTLNVFIFGYINSWWGVNKQDVLLSLKGKKKYTDINLVISSQGGDLSEALTIRDLFKSYPANVTVYLTGICASAATVIADAGDRVIMSKACMYMIHKPLFEYTGGNADELRKDADILDKWEEIVLDIYEPRTGLSREVLSGLMREPTFMTSSEALSLGFVDEATDVLDIDFDVDTAGAEEEDEMFICHPIYFKNQKEVFNQAVTNALKGGYRQTSEVKMQAIQNKKSIKKNNNMKDLFQKIVGMFISKGILPENKKEEAINLAGEIEIPEMIASIVKDQLKTASPQMKAEDVVSLIEKSSDDQKKKIATALGVTEKYDDKALSDKIAALVADVAALKVGEGKGGGQQGNGGSGIDPSGNQQPKDFGKKQEAKFYLEAFENGYIDRATYKQLTGEDAPKHERGK